MTAAAHHAPHAWHHVPDTGLITATLVGTNGCGFTVTADRLSENFALAPAVNESDACGPVLSTHTWCLLHLASGYPLFQLTQYDDAHQPMCLDRGAVLHFAQWLESVGGWSAVTTAQDFGRVPVSDRQLRVIRAILANPNRAFDLIAQYRASTPLVPGGAPAQGHPRPTVMRIRKADRGRPTQRRLDPRLQFVPPLHGRG